MRSVYLCFLLVPVVLASTDILVTPQGPVVGWTDSENNAYLLNPSTHSVPEQIGQVYDRLQLSFCEDADTEPVILVAFGSWFYWYAQVNTYSASNFSLITQQELSHEDFAPPEYCTVLALPVLPRYINSSEQRIALIDLQTGCTDVQDHRYLTVCSVDPWSSCLISPVDTSNWIETSTHSSRFTSLMAGGSFSPFALQTGKTCAPMGPTSFSVNSVFLDDSTLASENIFHVLGGAIDPVPNALALGMCSSGQLGLLNDTAGVVWSADFAGSPISPDLSQIEIDHTDLPFPAAMTCSTNDDGLLLAWFSGDEIIVRHWQDQWSTYSHAVESCGNVGLGNISVCSDIDGYWVAWLEAGSSVPEVRFISRETVTGIDKEDSSLPNGAVSFSVSPNPVRDHASVNFLQSVATHYQISLYDLSGRKVLYIASGHGDGFTGVVSLETFPCGVYIMRLVTSDLERSLLVLHTGN
ncbi:MAG: T9SS type A sorting domain-containing protein [Candidatus Sabulitectum sp.]|nr:T9SS type A sorting domain-containing protein [Candidatus Sabulitectum sp.]